LLATATRNVDGTQKRHLHCEDAFWLASTRRAGAGLAVARLMLTG
jgi:hypothetical protein